MKHLKRTAILLLLTSLLLSVCAFPALADESDNYVAAHWKFQNSEDCYTGSIEDGLIRRNAKNLTRV